MKKILLTISLFVFCLHSFSQDMKKNGIIYITHPYIDVINKATTAYLTKDDAANKKFYSDTARWWVSGMPKPMAIADAIKMWDTDFDFYDSIKVKTIGYPDYLSYDKDTAKVVQSWWQWTGKSKKTGEKVKIDYVQFDDFNTAGKIVFESIYGDFSKMVKE